MLSILGRRGERRVPGRERGRRGREGYPLAGKRIEVGRSPKNQKHKPGDLDGIHSERCFKEVIPGQCCSLLSK